MPPSVGKHVFFSGRFDGGPKQRMLIDISEHLKLAGWQTYVVSVGPGESFGPATEIGLHGMHTMVSVVFDDYGERTEAVHCTWYELGYAYEWRKCLLALRFSDQWPPRPGGQTEEHRVAATARLEMVFHPSLVYIDARQLDAAACARELCRNLERLRENGHIAVDAPPLATMHQQVRSILGHCEESHPGALGEMGPSVDSIFSEHMRLRPKIALVGPSSAGKTMLIDGLQGELLLPSKVSPNTFLPVHLIAGGATEGFKARFVGQGLADVLADNPGTPWAQMCDDLDHLSSDEFRLRTRTYNQVCMCIQQANAHLRQVFAECDSFPRLAQRYPSVSAWDAIAGWRGEVGLPGPAGPFTFVDLPGGGEVPIDMTREEEQARRERERQERAVRGRGPFGEEEGSRRLVGSAIYDMLKCQVAGAALTICTVAADNWAPLKDEMQMRNFLGHRLGKTALLAINKVETPEGREAAEEALGDPLVGRNLGLMSIAEEARFPISARVMLASKFVTALLPEAPVGGHGARSIALNDVLTRYPLVARACKRAAAACTEAAEAGQLPLLADCRCPQQLEFVYETVLPGRSPARMERLHRRDLPQMLAENESYSENRAFEAAVARATQQGPQLLAEVAMDAVIDQAEELLRRCANRVNACRRSREEAAAMHRALEELCGEPRRAELAQELLGKVLALEPVRRAVAAVEDAAERLAGAPGLQGEELDEVMGSDFALELRRWAWAPSHEHGEWQIGGGGRAQTVLHALQRRAAAEVAAALLGLGGEEWGSALGAACLAWVPEANPARGVVLDEATELAPAAPQAPQPAPEVPADKYSSTMTRVVLRFISLGHVGVGAVGSAVVAGRLAWTGTTYLLGGARYPIAEDELRLDARLLRSTAPEGARCAVAAVAGLLAQDMGKRLHGRAEAEAERVAGRVPAIEEAERLEAAARELVARLKAHRARAGP